MEQVLHGSARTTAAVRRAIQHSQESLKILSGHYGINSKTVAKWKGRSHVTDAPMGPKQPHSTVLTKEEEAVIVALRRHTLLPLDNCLYALQATIPHLTRSALHRCLKRYGINRLPDIEGDKPAKKKFKPTRLATFIWKLPRCARRKAGYACSSPLTALASSPMPSCTRKRTK
jgi:hypothetical protein